MIIPNSDQSIPKDLQEQPLFKKTLSDTTDKILAQKEIQEKMLLLKKQNDANEKFSWVLYFQCKSCEKTFITTKQARKHLKETGYKHKEMHFYYTQEQSPKTEQKILNSYVRRYECQDCFIIYRRFDQAMKHRKKYTHSIKIINERVTEE